MFTDTFSVLDVETTGLGRQDRVAEVALVTVDHTGKQLDRWETLVNPERDLGPQHIHGIRGEEIRKAPTFAEIADELEFRLSGNVLVAHNLSFDGRFLVQEYGRLGRMLPEQFLELGMCTMSAARAYLPGSGRSLRDCCDAFSIGLHDAHCAGADAEATATLLGRYLDLDASPWHSALEQALDWYRIAPPIARVAYRKPIGWEPPHFLERLASTLPPSTGPAEHDEYLALLDRALLDRYLSASEKEELLSLAAELGLDRATARALHREYFDAVVDAAWEDGIVTEAERTDLELLARLLGMDDGVLAAAFEPRLRRESPRRATPTLTPAVGRGDLVCLTGDMRLPREEIVERLKRTGIAVHPGVTKKVKLLIAADPDSLSGKAKKARNYGIPVVNEDYLFAQLLSESTQASPALPQLDSKSAGTAELPTGNEANNDGCLGGAVIPMSVYERRMWDKVNEHWQRRNNRRGLPNWASAALERSSDVVGKAATRVADAMPEAVKQPIRQASSAVAESAMRPALSGAAALLELVNEWAIELNDPASVEKLARKQGLELNTFTELRQHDLKVCDRLLAFNTLTWRTAGAVEGGAMGMLAMVPIAGIPIALSADILVIQVLSTSIATRIAYSYGFDAKDPDEQAFIQRLVRRSFMAQAAKAKPLNETAKAANAINGRMRWSPKLRQDHRLLAALEKLLQQLGPSGSRVSVQNVAKVVPYVGVLIGAGTNSVVLGNVAADARRYCQTRFLCEKYGLPLPAALTTDSDEAPESDAI